MALPRIKLAVATWILIQGILASTAGAQRQMEPLGRGTVAIPQDGGKVFVGWRLLGTDPDDVAFNVYRSTGGASTVKLNPEALRYATHFVDIGANGKEALSYIVRTVHDGREGEAGHRSDCRPMPRPGRISPSRCRRSPAIHRTMPRSATSTATANTRSSSSRR